MMTSSTKRSFRPQRRQIWARTQQRLRRKFLLLHPVTFCLLVILATPYFGVMTEEEGCWVMEQRCFPQVEAIPFFRQRRKTLSTTSFTGRRRNEMTSAFPSSPSFVIDILTSLSGGAATPENLSSLRGSSAAATLAEEPEQEIKDDETIETEDTALDTSSISSSSSSEPEEAVYDFPLFVNSATFENDLTGVAPIPFRYYEAHQRKDEISRKAVLETLKWRKEMEIDTILSRPNPNYDIAKRVLPHYFIGRSAVSNHVVFVQRPGVADVKLGKHNGLDFHDILNQYAYVFEYCWNILHNNTQETMEGDEDLMIGIMDLQGLNLGLLRKPDLINMAKEIVGMIDSHYPTRAYKTYLVNAPGFFKTLYKLISPIMRESTKEKIVLYSPGKEQDEALENALGIEMAETLKEAIKLPDKKKEKTKKNDQNDLALSSDILLETEMEKEIRAFVS